MKHEKINVKCKHCNKEFKAPSKSGKARFETCAFCKDFAIKEHQFLKNLERAEKGLMPFPVE